MLSFLGLNASRYLLYVLFAASIVAAIWFGIHQWEAKIAEEARLEFNNEQLQQTIKDQKIIDDKLSQVNADQKKIIDDLNTKNQALTTSVNNLNEYLSSDAAKKANKLSSDVLKKTIEELNKESNQ